MAEEDDTEDQLRQAEGAEIPVSAQETEGELPTISRADYNRYLESLPTISRADYERAWRAEGGREELPPFVQRRADEELALLLCC